MSTSVMCTMVGEKPERGARGLLLCPGDPPQSARCEKFSLWAKGNDCECTAEADALLKFPVMDEQV